MTPSRRLHTWWFASVSTLISGPAWADEASTVNPPEPSVDEPDPERWEPGILPAINYNSDLGFGVGAVGTLARFEPGYNPYRFRGQGLIFLTIKQDEAGDYVIPFQSHSVNLDFPNLFEDRLRLGVGASFGKFSTNGYYGLGAGSERVEFSDAELESSEEARRFHQYDRTFPLLNVDARIKLYSEPVRRGKRRLELLTGLEANYNLINIYPGSELEADVALAQNPTPGSEAMSELLFGTEDHARLGLKIGVLWDTRDQEFSPSRGTFTEAAALVSPGVDAGLHYVRFHLGSRWFAPLFREYIVVASRTVADFIVGDAPLYELTRYGVLEPLDGPGGARSVRGLLLNRFYGKIKAIGNLELRGNTPWFDVAGERIRLGLVGFGDAGRVWADYERRDVGGQALDGPYAPIQVGLGGGARIQWGETFIIRVDYGVSPTDDTTGFYIDLGHVF